MNEHVNSPNLFSDLSFADINIALDELTREQSNSHYRGSYIAEHAQRAIDSVGPLGPYTSTEFSWSLASGEPEYGGLYLTQEPYIAYGLRRERHLELIADYNGRNTSNSRGVRIGNKVLQRYDVICPQKMYLYTHAKIAQIDWDYRDERFPFLNALEAATQELPLAPSVEDFLIVSTAVEGIKSGLRQGLFNKWYK